MPNEWLRARIALLLVALMLGGCHWPKVSVLGDDYVLSPFPSEVDRSPGGGAGTGKGDAAISAPRP